MTSWRRLRRKWRLSTPKKLSIVAAVPLAAVLLGQAAPEGQQTPAPATVADAPGSASPGAGGWARAFLRAIPEPVTACNLAAVEAWEAAEGGGVTNAATYNRLNTAQPEPGSYAINRDGVQAFPTWSEGLQANVQAITNGRYGGILSALQAGNNAQAVASAVASSSWGTAWFPANC